MRANFCMHLHLRFWSSALSLSHRCTHMYVKMAKVEWQKAQRNGRYYQSQIHGRRTKLYLITRQKSISNTGKANINYILAKLTHRNSKPTFFSAISSSTTIAHFFHFASRLVSRWIFCVSEISLHSDLLWFFFAVLCDRQKGSKYQSMHLFKWFIARNLDA